MQVGQRTLAALGTTVSADKARAVRARWALSVSGDYAAATATFDQARALAEQVGNERALADVLHMQTLHHLVYAEFAEGIASACAPPRCSSVRARCGICAACRRS